MIDRLLYACAAAAAVFSVAAWPQAWAQRADAPFSGNTVPQGSPIPRILPTVPTAVGPGPALNAPAAPAVVPDAVVAVQSVSVVGATAFRPARTDPLVANLIGAAVPLQKIEQARAALVSLYRRHGYILTTVNAELAGGGVLRFNVVEGRVVDVKLDGDIGPAGVQVLRFLRHLTEVQALDNATLERWLLLAQDVPGVTLHAVLRPSVDDPGALTLVAQVSHKVADGLFTIDNRASRLTGPEEGLAILDLNSVTQFGERTEVSFYHTNGDTQNFGQVSTDFFVGGSGLHIRLYAGNGKSRPSDYLRAIDYEGFTDTFGAAAIYPVIRSRQQTLNAVLSVDAVESEIRSDSGPAGEQVRTSRDSYRAVRLAGEYALEDVWLGDQRPAADYATIRVSHGFAGGTGSDNPLPGRAGENLDFTAANFELTRSQSLLVPWKDASVALKARLLGQVTGDILPPAEEYFLGGSEIDRGYYSGQVSGDNALAESAELQLNTALRAVPFGVPISVTGQFYLFFDHGQIWQNTAAEPNVHLSSEGLGTRINLTRYAEFDVEGDIRNDRLPFGTPGAVRPIKADAVYWRVLARF